MGEVEQWKDVVGYEGYYQVSNLGRVKSVDRVNVNRLGVSRKLKGRILRPAVRTKYGYLGVILSKNNIKQTILVHKLVATTWLGPQPKGQQIRHGAGRWLDNSVKNLCYGTHRDQRLDMIRDGTHDGRPVRRSDGQEFLSLSEAARKSNCTATKICAVCRNERKTTGGYGWEYI